MEIKQEFPDTNLIEVKPEPISLSNVKIQKIEETLIPQEDACLKREYNIKNEILDLSEVEIKRECSIEVKSEHLIPEKLEYNIKNESLDIETDLKTEYLDFEEDSNKIVNKKEQTSQKYLSPSKPRLKGKKACEICFKRFNIENLKKHLKIHINEESFNCEICLRRFSFKRNLERHLKIHTSKKPFKCQICLKHFSHKFSLNNHLKNHTDEKSFKCEICLKQLTRKDTLTRHLKIHTGESSFRCEICFRQFTHRSKLNYHLKNHPVRKFLNTLVVENGNPFTRSPTFICYPGKVKIK